MRAYRTQAGKFVAGRQLFEARDVLKLATLTSILVSASWFIASVDSDDDVKGTRSKTGPYPVVSMCLLCCPFRAVLRINRSLEAGLNTYFVAIFTVLDSSWIV